MGISELEGIWKALHFARLWNSKLNERYHFQIEGKWTTKGKIISKFSGLSFLQGCGERGPHPTPHSAAWLCERPADMLLGTL